MNEALIVLGLAIYVFVVAFVLMLAKASRKRDDEWRRLVRRRVEDEEREALFADEAAGDETRPYPPGGPSAAFAIAGALSAAREKAAHDGEHGGVTNYSRGADFERAVCDYLTGRGAVCVRAAGSHGIADVVALWPGAPAWLIQAKISGKISPEERRALGQAAHKYGLVPVKASRTKRGKLQFERYHSFATAGYMWSELTP